MDNKIIFNETLPCFRHIVLKLNKDNTAAIASFALALIQYLNKNGITESSEIEQQFFKITLLSQFNPLSNASVDLLQLDDKKFTLNSQEDLSAYMDELLKICKKPRSFSALYKTADSKLSACRFCPSSEHYTLQYRNEELQLLRYIFIDAKHFRKIITCIDDIEKIFISYNELYNIFGNIVKVIAFPDISNLVYAIYQNMDTYFHPIFQTRNFQGIESDFAKKLKTYGIKGNIENLPDTFVKDIYSYLEQLALSVDELSDNDALEIREKLIHREKYVPTIDADAILEFVEPKASRTSSKTIKKGKKEIETVPVKSALSYTIDSEMGLDTPLKEYKVEGSLETDIDKDIPIPSEEEFKNIEPEHLNPDTADILSSKGDVIVEHTASEDSVIFDFDEEEDIDFSDDEDTELPTNEDVGFEKDVENVPSTDGELTTQQLEEKDQPEDDESEHIINDNDGSSDNQVSASGNIDDTTDSDLDYKQNNLCMPYMFNSIHELEDIEYISDQSTFDKILSYSLLDGFCTIEIAKDNKTRDWLIVCVNGSMYRTDLAQPFFVKLLSFGKVQYIFSTRPLAMYSFITDNGISIRKGRIVPIDFLVFDTLQKEPTSKIQEMYHYVYPKIKELIENDGQDGFMRSALFYNIYGTSLLRERYFTYSRTELATLDDIAATSGVSYSFVYDENGKVCPVLFDNNITISEVKNEGALLFLTYNQTTADTSVYEKLTESVLLSLAEKGCFNKFDISLLYYCPTYFVMYADRYSLDYIYNVILISLFKESTNLGLYPFNVSLKKRMLEKKENSKKD